MPASPYIGCGPEHLELWTKKLVSPTFVYVIQGPERDTPIKVGFARDVMARIATLQTGNPATLRLLHVVPGEQRLEWFLHQRLKGARIRGEWFKAGKVQDRFLQHVSDLADWMVENYDGSGGPPHYADFDRSLAPPTDGQRTPVTVRFMQADPTDPETAEKVRRYAKGGLRPYEYLNPDGTLKDLEPGPKRANLPPLAFTTRAQEEAHKIVESWRKARSSSR